MKKVILICLLVIKPISAMVYTKKSGVSYPEVTSAYIVHKSLQELAHNKKALVAYITGKWLDRHSPGSTTSAVKIEIFGRTRRNLTTLDKLDSTSFTLFVTAIADGNALLINCAGAKYETKFVMEN